MVVPGGFPTGGTPLIDEPSTLPVGDGLPGLPDAPLDIPPGLAAATPPLVCANAIEPESASAPANAIVANFIGHSPSLLRGDNPGNAGDVPVASR